MAVTGSAEWCQNNFNATGAKSEVLQYVAELVFFCLEVIAVVLMQRYLQRDALDDLQAEPFKAVNFARIIRHYAQFGKPQIAEYLAADAVH